MATKHQEIQHLIRHYKDKTGKQEVEMREVEKFANKLGWGLPTPKDPFDVLASEFSKNSESIRFIFFPFCKEAGPDAWSGPCR